MFPQTNLRFLLGLNPQALLGLSRMSGLMSNFGFGGGNGGGMPAGSSGGPSFAGTQLGNLVAGPQPGNPIGAGYAMPDAAVSYVNWSDPNYASVLRAQPVDPFKAQAQEILAHPGQVAPG